MVKSHSLRRKFVRTLLFVSALISLPAMAVVAFTSIKTSSQQLDAVQAHIEQGILSKGKVLTENHALALGSLSLDNAFVDMQKLVAGAVSRDEDVVYGIYVDAEGSTVAFSKRGIDFDPNGAPSVDAWRLLRLNGDDVNVKEPHIRHATVLGHDIVEVAVPVRGGEEEEGEAFLGTIRYGFSTKRKADALLVAERDSRGRLQGSIALLAAVIGIATAVGLLLSRAQAGRITRPLTELTDAAQRLASGDRTVRVAIDSGDELSQLGSSFNEMVDDLDASYRALEEANQTLEANVALRTAELARKNHDMRLVLENVDQGFITLDERGVISGEASRIVDEWFGPIEAGIPVWEYIAKVAEGFAFELEFAWEQLQAGLLPQPLCLSQLPETCRVLDRTWRFRYSPFTTEEGVRGYLVVVANVTEKLALEREEAAQRELVEIFKRINRDRTGFFAFLRKANQLMPEVLSGELRTDPLVLRRSIHTLKGNCDMMGLAVVARICHGLEDALDQDGHMPAALLHELETHWASLQGHVEALVGRGGDNKVEIARAEYDALVQRAAAAGTDREVLSQLQLWQRAAIKDELVRLGEQARGIARRLGKGELDVVIDDGGVRLDPVLWAALVTELGHLIRNAIDHGLESEAERLLLKKPRNGRISLSARIDAGTFRLDVEDDGRGLDWAKVRAVADERGIKANAASELVEALFLDGFTTKEQASVISGRGVGMAAVKKAVESVNGRITVQTRPGQGTQWSILVPLSNEWPRVSAA